MNPALSLRNYKEWKHCITQLCKIPLTLPYVETRLRLLQDPTDFTTQRFAETWGEAHLSQVIDWFRLAEQRSLEARLHALNPAAPIVATTNGKVDAARLFDAGLYNPETKSDDVRRWLKAEAYEEGHAHGHGHHHGHNDGHEHDAEHGHGHHDHQHDVNRHDSSIHATCLTFEQPLKAHVFERWLDILTAFKGADILRVKGIVNIAEEVRPVVIHGVQHIFHPPVLLDEWPSDDRRTRLVFITRNVTPDELQGTLALMTLGLGQFGLQGLVDNVPPSGLLTV